MHIPWIRNPCRNIQTTEMFVYVLRSFCLRISSNILRGILKSNIYKHLYDHQSFHPQGHEEGEGLREPCLVVYHQ